MIKVREKLEKVLKAERKGLNYTLRHCCHEPTAHVPCLGTSARTAQLQLQTSGWCRRRGACCTWAASRVRPAGASWTARGGAHTSLCCPFTSSMIEGRTPGELDAGDKCIAEASEARDRGGNGDRGGQGDDLFQRTTQKIVDLRFVGERCTYSREFLLRGCCCSKLLAEPGRSSSGARHAAWQG